MKKVTCGKLLLCIFVLLFCCVPAEALSLTVWDEKAPPVYTKPDSTGFMPEGAIGYFQKNFTVAGEDRALKVYLAPGAYVRPFFTVIAVPDGVKTDDFLVDSGWTDYANEMKEGLYVLEPLNGAWGSIAEEKAYIDQAMFWLVDNSLKVGEGDNARLVMSSFRHHYAVGYGEGAKHLEEWVTRVNGIYEGTLLTTAQAYVTKEGASQSAFSAMADRKWSTRPSSPYSNLVNQPEYTKDFTMADVEVPSYFVTSEGSMDPSIAHWRKANDVAETGTVADGAITYRQKIDSKRWATTLWNRVRKDDGESTGFSQVVVKTVPESEFSTVANYYKYTQEITNFFKQFARYDRGFPFGNVLYARADKKSLNIRDITVDMAGTDYDGVTKSRTFMLYIPPEASTSNKVPLVIAYPGTGQTANVSLDGSALWWYSAKKEKFALAIFFQEYVAGANNYAVVSQSDNVPNVTLITDAILKKLKDDYGVIDEERIYLTGHSAGSMSISSMVRNPEKFAATASYSGVSPNVPSGITNSDLPIPVYFMFGECEVSADSTANNTIPNQPNPWTNSRVGNITQYLDYHFTNWDLTKGEFALKSTEHYDFVDTVGQKTVNDPIDGSLTWTWSVKSGGQKIPVVKYSSTANRAHDNLAGYNFLSWDFVKHFKVTQNADGSQTRYYSPSAFAKANDAVDVTAASNKSGGGGCSITAGTSVLVLSLTLLGLSIKR
ncbi:hypothetical protein FACS1894187_03470 [Synergistales bacterium]|nr:hypothetical protein FACS1894187_03470 [Synergistales bacterium]